MGSYNCFYFFYYDNGFRLKSVVCLSKGVFRKEALPFSSLKKFVYENMDVCNVDDTVIRLSNLNKMNCL